MLHPSVQVGRYQMYLVDTHTAFYERRRTRQSHRHAPICTTIRSSHRMPFSPRSSRTSSTTVATVHDGRRREARGLPDISRVSEPGGLDVLRRVEESEYRPSKKLMDHVSSVINGHSRVRPSGRTSSSCMTRFWRSPTRISRRTACGARKGRIRARASRSLRST